MSCVSFVQWLRRMTWARHTEDVDSIPTQRAQLFCSVKFSFMRRAIVFNRLIEFVELLLEFVICCVNFFSGSHSGNPGTHVNNTKW